MVLFLGEPSSKDFDITLMICLLRNLIPHIAIMDRLPSATDTSLGADLSRIKYYRNIIVHQCDDALVNDTDFESYWKDVTPVIHNYFSFYKLTRTKGSHELFSSFGVLRLLFSSVNFSHFHLLLKNH
jgi:hypothetical protein